ncbi:MAG: Ig-like domain-containing protein, partial [bacterium]|nr:Ig-like domain-containing protein [bacterium]
ATLTPDAPVEDTTNIITMDNSAVVDAAGNIGAGITDSNNYIIDNVRPTVTSIVVADTALAAGETSLVTITFSEAVTNFINTDLSIANGTLSPVSSADGGITWTATLTPTADLEDTTNIITLADASIADLAGNTNTGSTDSNNCAIDTLRPTATIVVDDTALKIGDTSLVTITFSEAVSGLTNADLSIANGTLSPVSSADGGITWTATLTPTADVEDTTNIITLANAGVADAAGNTNTGTTDSNNYDIDTLVLAPTVALNTDGGNNIDGTFTVSGYEVGATVEFRIDDGGGFSGWSNIPVTTISTAAGVKDYVLEVRQTDVAGNTSSSTVLEFSFSSDSGDILVGDGTDNILIGAGGNDTLQGLGGNDTLYGNVGNDTIEGGAGTNTLYGGDGDDTFIGGAGNDTMDGGIGTDTASYASAGSAITASLTNGLGTHGAYIDNYSNIENLTGGSGNDTLTGDSGINVLIGGSGDDTLEGLAGDDILTGGDGNDTVSYENSIASVTASLAAQSGSGADVGNDTYTDSIENLTGGSGNDILIGDDNDNILTGGAGGDELHGGGGSDTASYADAVAAVAAFLSFGSGFVGDALGDTYTSIENLIGGAGNDTLQGNASDNILDGRGGNDSLDGQGGIDTVSYATSTADVTASLLTNTGSSADAGSDTYTSIENLTGGSGNDTLTGDTGNNVLTGGAGEDTIYANQGSDTVFGGDNNDTIHVSSSTLPTSIDGGTDDGGSGDTLVLEDLGATFDLSGLAAVTNNIETLDIGDGIDTEITISALDIQSMVNDGTSSVLTINADSGADSLVIDLSGGETTDYVFGDPTASGTYTIYSSATQIPANIVAQINWDAV